MAVAPASIAIVGSSRISENVVRSAFGVQRALAVCQLVHCGVCQFRRSPHIFGDEFSNSLPPATSNSLPSIACVPLPSGVGRPSRIESRGMPASPSALVPVPGPLRSSSQSPSRKPQGGAIKPLRQKTPKRPSGPAGWIVVYVTERMHSNANTLGPERSYGKSQVRWLFEILGSEEKAVVQAFVWHGGSVMTWSACN